VGIVGARGKLGREIEVAAAEFECAVTMTASRGEWVNTQTPDVVIDVSHDSAFTDVVDYCSLQRIPLIEGVSTLADEHLEELRRLSGKLPLVHAPNFTYGHYLQRQVLRALSGALRIKGTEWECTIVERHTTRKRDRPSATARELAALWHRASGCAVADVAAVRGGLPLSDHEVILTLENEVLTVKHSVSDRKAAARSALLAGSWIVAQPPGFYQMEDVFESVAISHGPAGPLKRPAR
jgi:4-hydroxy-tetrahydrodipicolinate reductase